MRGTALPSRLLRWYDRHRRDLPWRKTHDPYRIWLSEIMLQQTRVEMVRGYYQRFLERFPDLSSLAEAPLDEVLRLWAGLGYYARARHLHRAAQGIVKQHGGRFPSDPTQVRELPGIGRYTAGAILSIAFGKREALVDGNVVRVLARLFDLPGHAKEDALRERCWELAQGLVPADRPGDFNQALMELGATVCVPGAPSCGACPLSTSCLGRERAASIPAPAPRLVRPHRHWDCALLEEKGRLLLVRRPEEGLLGGLWELPSAERKGRAGKALGDRLRALGLGAVKVGVPKARVEHAFTHFDLTLTAYACQATGPAAEGAWVAAEQLASYGMGAAMRRVLETARGGAQGSGLPQGARPNRSRKRRSLRSCSGVGSSAAAQRKTSAP